MGATVLFESSGGQVDKVAHLPELRFALGEPDVDTTTIDSAATALAARGFFIRKVGTDGYRIHHQATLRKVVSDRQASLDEATEIKPATRKLVEGVFRQGATLPVVPFPADSAAVQDSPRLVLIVLDPEVEWRDGSQAAKRIGHWTKERGQSPRLYPGSLVWCARKPGRELRDKVALWLAWQRVAREVTEGVLGGEFDRAERADIQARLREAEEAAQDEVWAGYRFVVLSDAREPHGFRVIDLGAGHSSASETLCGRIIGALRSEALLNETIGAGYIDRHWPPAFADTGAWPLTSLRQSFLDGSLTRLVDPDTILRQQIPQFVARGDFGLASDVKDDGGYGRLWYAEPVGPEEMAFESGVFLLTKAKAEALRIAPTTSTPPEPVPDPAPAPEPQPAAGPAPDGSQVTLRLSGAVPPESWNRFGTRVLPKLRSGDDLSMKVEFSVRVQAMFAGSMETDLQQILDDLGLGDQVRVEKS